MAISRTQRGVQLSDDYCSTDFGADDEADAYEHFDSAGPTLVDYADNANSNSREIARAHVRGSAASDSPAGARTRRVGNAATATPENQSYAVDQEELPSFVHSQAETTTTEGETLQSQAADGLTPSDNEGDVMRARHRSSLVGMLRDLPGGTPPPMNRSRSHAAAFTSFTDSVNVDNVWLNDSHDVPSPLKSTPIGCKFDDVESSKTDGSSRSSRSALQMISRSLRRRDDVWSDSNSRGSRGRLSLSEFARSASLSASRSSLRQSLSKRRVVRRKGFHFAAAAVREPTIVLTPYGKDWALDALTLFHNALRKELKDLYEILRSIARCLLCLTPDHIRDFYSWFKLFRELLSRTFEMQHMVVIPKISAFLPLANGLDEECILDHHRNLLLYANRIERLKADFLVRANESAFVNLVFVVDDFAKSLLALLSLLETNLPSLVRLVSRANAMANETRQFVKKSNKASVLLPLLVRPMGPKESAAWLSKNLAGKWRLRWSSWQSGMEKAHFRIVEKFRTQVADLEIQVGRLSMA